MKLLASILAATLGFASLTVSAADVTPLSASSNLTVDSGFGVATLSNVGSFEYGLASTQTGTMMKGHLWESAYNKGLVTAAQAEAAHDQLQAILNLTAKSLAACKQDNKTGKCMGNRKLAIKYELQAKAAYAKLPADPSFQ